MTSRLSCASALRKLLARLALSTMRSSSCGRPRVSRRCNSISYQCSRSRGASLQAISRLRAMFFQTAARVLHPLQRRPAFSSTRRAGPRSDPRRDNRECGRFRGRGSTSTNSGVSRSVSMNAKFRRQRQDEVSTRRSGARKPSFGLAVDRRDLAIEGFAPGAAGLLEHHELGRARVDKPTQQTFAEQRGTRKKFWDMSFARQLHSLVRKAGFESSGNISQK